MKVYGITGRKNSGKTTLVEKLVTELTSRGFHVSTIKRAYKDADIDRPGKDSYRHRKAGAQQVILSTEQGWALMAQASEVPLKTLLEKMDSVDLVIIEGHHGDDYPKIETFRKGQDKGMVGAKLPSIRAVATDELALSTDLDCLDLNDVKQIADYIIADVALVPLSHPPTWNS